jgi:2',3'-cyclic-nucleotide 2'-phosphodiesterase
MSGKSRYSLTRVLTEMQILFIGDIFGKPGREIARRVIPAIVEQRGIDFVIANVENSAAGFGVTGDIADVILSYGVDAMTTGNHVWDKKEVLDYLPREPRLLRPANYPAGVPGRGSYVGRTRSGEPVGVVNLMGRVFMTPLDDPFAVALKEVEALRARARVVIVDFHAEATSEKIAMGWHLDGRVTAVLGTHTHVQTADERILPKGTACLTDVGMTGPHDSIIGVTVDAALGRFLNSMPAKFEAATGPGRLNAVVITADPKTGRAVAIERLNLSAQEVEALAATSAASGA